MIDTSILALYLPYSVQFRDTETQFEYTMYSMSVEGDILVKDESGNSQVIAAIHVGDQFKIILKGLNLMRDEERKKYRELSSGGYMCTFDAISRHNIKPIHHLAQCHIDIFGLLGTDQATVPLPF